MLLGFSPQIIADLGISNAQYGFLVGAVWVMSFGVMALARFFVARGDAALVPAAVSLLTELFPEKKRGTVMGVFFMEIPMGIGVGFLLAGTFGATHGWRSTFYTLGVVGIAIALLLAFLKDDRSNAPAHERGAPFVQQVRTVLGLMRQRTALLFLVVGFVLIHVLFASLSFTQLWLVQERGMDAASIASRIGALQLLFGALGAVVGGVVGDRLARRIPGGHAGVIVLFIALCAVPMIAYRFVAPGSWLFYRGMCAGFFLPLGSYGPANAAIMGMVPPQTRSTVSGFTMLCINILAIAIANLVAGRAVDVLIAQGVSSPLTHVVLATDVIGIGSIFFFALAAVFSAGHRAGRGTAPTAAVQPVADTAR
jgi:predicted MFS family arabinose efflux permease